MSKIAKSPGEFLTNMLEKRKISILQLSKDIFISQSAARLIAAGKTKISISVALRLARYFDTVPEYWLKMQMNWDLTEAAQDKKLMDDVKKIAKFQGNSDAGKKPPAKKAAAKTDAGKKADAKTKKPAAKAAAAKKAPEPKNGNGAGKKAGGGGKGAAKSGSPRAKKPE